MPINSKYVNTNYVNELEIKDFYNDKIDEYDELRLKLNEAENDEIKSLLKNRIAKLNEFFVSMQKYFMLSDKESIEASLSSQRVSVVLDDGFKALLDDVQKDLTFSECKSQARGKAKESKNTAFYFIFTTFIKYIYADFIESEDPDLIHFVRSTCEKRRHEGNTNDLLKDLMSKTSYMDRNLTKLLYLNYDNTFSALSKNLLNARLDIINHVPPYLEEHSDIKELDQAVEGQVQKHFKDLAKKKSAFNRKTLGGDYD